MIDEVGEFIDADIENKLQGPQESNGQETQIINPVYIQDQISELINNRDVLKYQWGVYGTIAISLFACLATEIDDSNIPITILILTIAAGCAFKSVNKLIQFYDASEEIKYLQNKGMSTIDQKNIGQDIDLNILEP